MLLLLQQNLGFAWGTVSNVTVPNVVGETQAQATTDIQAVGLTVSVTFAYDALVTLGNVISQNPVGGTSVAPGSDVAIIVSLGPQPVSAAVGGGSSGGSPRFEFSKKRRTVKKADKSAEDDISEESQKTSPIVAKSDPALAKVLSVDLLSKLDDDEEVITAVIEYEKDLIAQFLSRLQ